MFLQKVCFFLLAAALGFFLISAVVYCEHSYDKENQLYADPDEDDSYPSWLMNLNSLS